MNHIKLPMAKMKSLFFVASDDIDMADLQRYRQETKTECLIAMNTTNKNYDCLELADNVISCSPDEVQLVIQAFQRLHSGSGIIGMSWDEVKWAISGNKNIEFLHGVAGGENCVALGCEQFISKLQRLSSNYPIKNVMINMFADISFGCEQQDFIIQQIDKNLVLNDATTFYQLSFFDEFADWKSGERGCCVCMFLIYADKSNDSLIKHI
ncbi:hypothetical protein H9W84_10680 [Moraxella sp. PS-22]|uniref:Uncharacterized protein n=1 Tax=Moraxella tetraodonis TaxID=2767221 RepID=A0A9X1UTH3_9GAMM|nr:MULTISPECIES: hypothetical protein [Moraxella]MCG8148586.1 hypothetical protein [Moraxella tetraodonis]